MSIYRNSCFQCIFYLSIKKFFNCEILSKWSKDFFRLKKQEFMYLLSNFKYINQFIADKRGALRFVRRKFSNNFYKKINHDICIMWRNGYPKPGYSGLGYWSSVDKWVERR